MGSGLGHRPGTLRARRSSSGANPQSASACAAVAARRAERGVEASPGVWPKRGAGAGWVTPSKATWAPRAPHVGMLRRFIHGERGRKTGVASGGALHPFVARTGPEDCGETLPHRAARRGDRSGAGRSAAFNPMQASRFA